MKNKTFIVFLLFVVFLACKKENTHEKILPGKYFPVYPNSYWKYVNQDGDTVTHSTSADYILYSFLCKAFNTYTDSVYVPFWNGKPIYAYSTPVLEESMDKGKVFMPLLSENKGYEWLLWYSAKDSILEYVKTVDTALTLQSILYQHVIVVKKDSWDNKLLSDIHNYRFYARDIGLIKDMDVNESNNDTIRKIELFEYHIGQ